MKITKKMRKKDKGMNHATLQAYNSYIEPKFNTFTGWTKQMTYVNPVNFL